MTDRRLAIEGGTPLVQQDEPHFQWPPPVPELPGVIAAYLAEGGPVSIVDRGGVYGRLEDKLSALHGRRHAILMSSGTMALYSAFFALGIEPGDEVISTVYSFQATAAPLLHLGARVVFCDVEPDTGNIDLDQAAALITPRTKALVTNHMWGHPIDVPRARALCDRHGIAWIEDGSHAHFAEHQGRFVGSEGDVAVFSLQGNKLLTGGEGGVLLCDDRQVYERATLLGHNLKRSRQEVRDPQWAPLARSGFGLKLRMHPLAAVMVEHLLEHHCFAWIEQRARSLARFTDGLEATGVVQGMARRPYVTSMGAHYGFKPRLDFAALGVRRERLVQALQAEGLDVSVPGSVPFDRMALFDAERFRLHGFDKHDNARRSYPGADAYYGSILSLPTFTFEHQWPLMDRYVEAFHKVVDRLEVLR
jgi:perosamine synthetase